jgi:hypothetical protein
LSAWQALLLLLLLLLLLGLGQEGLPRKGRACQVRSGGAGTDPRAAELSPALQ